MNDPRLGIFLIATGRYIGFFDQLHRSIERHFFKRSAKRWFLCTDARRPFPGNVQVFEIERLGFPGDTLYRYHRLCGLRDHLRAQAIDVLYFFDVDMRVVSDVAEEFLPSPARPLLAVIHPGFHEAPSGGTPERDPASTACIGAGETYPRYICGGVQGGLVEPYLEAAARMREMIDVDDRRGVMARWHDESHWNRYMASNVGLFTFKPPDYCYPESWTLRGCRPRILALDKDHDWYRGITDRRKAPPSRLMRLVTGRGLRSALRLVLPKRWYGKPASWWKAARPRRG